MADTKISALTALTGANSAPADLLPIVDVSDTTMAASGTTKVITREELQTFTLGTITTDRKIADYSVTWNAAGVTFTGFKMDVTDTASAAASLLVDLQVGGVSKYNRDKDGYFYKLDAAGVVTWPLVKGGGWGTNSNLNIYNSGGTQFQFRANTTTSFQIDTSGTFSVVSALGFSASGGSSGTAFITRAANNSLRFSPDSAATTTSRTEINKAVASIADNTATATFTVTVPNAAHSAMLKVTLVGSLGAGGAVGANEATGTISYDFAISRTAGVATVVTASTAYGSATSAVAGAATITVTAAASAMTGANSATQTFTIDVTIAKGSGSSANHTCLCYGRLLNANTSGITIA